MEGGWVTRLLLYLAGAAVLVSHGSLAIITDETEGEEFMKELDARYSYECNREMVARWDYITDVMNSDKEIVANEAAVRYMGFKGEAAVNASQYAYEGFTDTELYRRFRFLSKQGPGALDNASLTEYKNLQAHMETIYSTATICDFNNPTQCDLVLEPDLEAIMATSENWDELRYVWEEWRDKSGKLMRGDFIKFVELSNQAAKLDGFVDTGEYWLNGYTVTQREADVYTGGHSLSQEEFKQMTDAVWTQVSEGLYKKLHAYVRMRLQDVYPGKIDPTGPIPSHILGNMWAQQWGNIARFVMPFPEMPTFDVTESMKENGWDIQQMFNAAEDFFKSLDLFPMTQTFWDKSVINQTAWGKTIVCHASAEDFCLGSESEDFRIKMCTEVNMEDLVTVHHEMGHIEYFMAYKNQPHVFRDSANPGFHEAMGDLIALSVSTPQHLENILGLTPSRQKDPEAKYTDDEKRDLNFLMKMALDKIAFLPFGYLIDKYRWGVYDGSITSDNLNAGWWDLRESLQGVSPPEGVRGEEFFDPGAKYHVPANVPYIRYFVSFIVQFQFHKRLCEAAGHTGPLYNCDIYNNKDAGLILSTAMEKGFSEPWPKVLSELGGSSDMDPQPIIEYFQPLIDYLDEELLKNGQCIGWGSDCAEKIQRDSEPLAQDSSSTPDPESSTGSTEDGGTDEGGTEENTEGSSTMEPMTTQAPEDAAREAMAIMNENMTQEVQAATLIDWQYYTDVTDENEAASSDAWTRVSELYAMWHKEVIEAYPQYMDFKDEALKRQFQLQQNLGIAALEPEHLKEHNDAVASMKTTYTNKVCPCDKDDCDEETEGISIEDLEKIMGISDDYDELLCYWERWREVSGKEMLNDFKTYVKMENKAAEMNGFNDAGEMWVEPYAEGNYTGTKFREDIAVLWKKVKPLYQKLHGYVSYFLKIKYGDKIKEDGIIPAHILGNMWAQSWENLYDLVKPFPEVNITDISEDLENNIMDERQMFLIAENFFTSLDLYPMGEDYRNNSLFVQPDDKEVICHASAWDFFDVVDYPTEGRFRIKMCTDKTQEDFIVIHHEMGHTEYQMAYSIPKEERPLVFRTGANPGFHEAIGDTIALSVSNPAHLMKISELLRSGFFNKTGEEDYEDYEEEDWEPVQVFKNEEEQKSFEYKEKINFLMKTALAKVAFLPFAYVLDEWRWGLFADSDNDYNRQWWDKRIKEQGIYPPVNRYPTRDFDPGSKYHVPAGVPYVRYFVSHILQFQFHERLCSLRVDVEDPTDVINCDIYNSTEAGLALKEMLNKGASEPWQNQLELFLGSKIGMNSSALLSYFQPLDDYLTEFLANNSIDPEPKWDKYDVDDYMKNEPADVPPTVPIVVGCILGAMVLIVLVAYFVGRNNQKKKAKKLAAAKSKGEGDDMEMHGKSNTGFEGGDAEQGTGGNSVGGGGD